MRRWQIRKRNADLERELQLDLELEEEEQRERGVPDEEAPYAARRAFGNAALIKDQTREVWGWVWLERLVQNMRYAARRLRRSPGFSVAAVTIIAVGIAVTATIYSIVYAVILHPLPFAQPYIQSAV